MANWALASDHSRAGMVHSFSDWFKTRNSNFIAASSVGKCPLARTALRSFEFSASIALVVYQSAHIRMESVERNDFVPPPTPALVNCRIFPAPWAGFKRGQRSFAAGRVDGAVDVFSAAATALRSL